MDGIKTIWTKGRLVTAWRMKDRYEVTVLDADKMAYVEGFTRCFADPEAAADYATSTARWLDRVVA
jgi:hypothetical protein